MQAKMQARPPSKGTNRIDIDSVSELGLGFSSNSSPILSASDGGGGGGGGGCCCCCCCCCCSGGAGDISKK